MSLAQEEPEWFTNMGNMWLSEVSTDIALGPAHQRQPLPPVFANHYFPNAAVWVPRGPGTNASVMVPGQAAHVPGPGTVLMNRMHLPLALQNVLPDLQEGDIPNRCGPDGQPTPNLYRNNTIIQDFLITPPGGINPLSVEVHPLGVTRLTIRFEDDGLKNSLLVDLSPNAVSTNPERILALIACVCANAYDPRRPPYQSSFGDDLTDLPNKPTFEVPGPFMNPFPVGFNPGVDGVDGRPFNGMNLDVNLLDTQGRWPRWFTPGGAAAVNMVADPGPFSLAQMINNPAALRGHQLVCKIFSANFDFFAFARENGVPMAMGVVPFGFSHPNHPFSPNHPLYGVGSYFQYIPINYVRTNGGVERHVPIWQSRSDYLKHLWSAWINSFAFWRQGVSQGRNRHGHHPTFVPGRMTMFFVDAVGTMASAVNPPQMPNIGRNRHAGGRPFRWTGCNDTTQHKRATINGLRTINPRSSSSQHNCLFACLRYARKDFLKSSVFNVSGDPSVFFNREDALFLPSLDGVRKENITIRELVGMDQHQPVNFMNEALLERIGEYMKTSFDIRHCITNEVMQTIMVPGSNVMAHLLYVPPNTSEHSDSEVGHVKYIRGEVIPKQTCKGCGKVFTVKHTCNAERRSYAKFQRKLPQDPAMFDIQRPDVTFAGLNYKTNYDQNVVFFDFETFHQNGARDFEAEDAQELPDGQDDPKDFDLESSAKSLQMNKHLVYSVGYWFEGSYHMAHGETCLDTFLEDLQEMQADEVKWTTNDGKTKTKKVPIPLVAWNGARYDFKILVNYIIEHPAWSGLINIRDMVLNNNRLMRLTLTFVDDMKEFVAFDPVLWISSSLSKACEAYKVNPDDAKGIFPHPLIRDHYTIDTLRVTVTELNEPRNYFLSDQRRLAKDPWTLEKVNRILRQSITSEVETFSLKDIHDYYLKNDVISMKEICKMFFSSLDDMFGAVSMMYLTISQFTFAQFAKHCAYIGQIFCPSSYDEFEHMSQAVYGGRTYPAIRFFQSRQVDMIQLLGPDWSKEKLENGAEISNTMSETLTFDAVQNDCLMEKDVTSLYPWAMSENAYPLGKSHFMTEEELVEINRFIQSQFQQRFNSTTTSRRCIWPRMMICHVRYDANPYLMHPVLPRRKKGGIIWDLKSGEGWYTSTELEMAVEAHYRIEVIKGYAWTSSARIFTDHIRKTFDIKEKGDREGNLVQRAIGKLMSNSTFGKLLQQPQRESVHIIKTRKELEYLCQQKVVTDMYFLPQEVLMMKCQHKDTTLNRPYYLGAFVLSFSRRRMFDNLCLLQPETITPPPLLNHINTITRTIRQTFYYTDTDCLYVRPGHLPMLEGSELGMLKNESMGSSSGRIIFAIFLGKKQYMYIYINKQNKLKLKMACKGISEPFLLFSDYLAAFYNIHYRRETTNQDAILSGGASDFFGVGTTSRSRTFHKSPFSARLPIDLETLELNSYAQHTIPHGHVLDTFGHGEEWWLRYVQQQPKPTSTSPAVWVDEQKLEIEKLKLRLAEKRKNRLKREFQNNVIDISAAEELQQTEETEEDLMTHVSRHRREGEDEDWQQFFDDDNPANLSGVRDYGFLDLEADY